MRGSFHASAYGGANWQPRRTTLRQEIGAQWHRCGVASEVAPLRAVLLHRPGAELEVADPEAALMLGVPDAAKARAQHDAMAGAYRAAGVQVYYVEPPAAVPPNQMFVADLMLMTPAGAIVGRPASEARAGEERWVARRLADMGVPILRTVGGAGTFEGADAAWVDPETVLLGTGLRTNAEGAAQVTATLGEIGVSVIGVDLTFGTMHLMGQLRFLDRDLAIVWPGRLAFAAVTALRARGYEVVFFPDETEAACGFAHNFVTLGPREILMPAGRPVSEAFYRSAGVTCHVVDMDELIKAAGGIGCLTAVVERA